jgi:hypothetical protein
LIDVARTSDLVARIQANLLVRMAEETFTAFGVRAGLIANRAGAGFTVARCFCEILAPGQAFAAAEDIAVWTTGPERVVRNAPGVRRAYIAGIGGTSATASDRTNRAPAVAMSTMLLNRDACRPGAKGWNRLAVGVRIASRATD